MGIPTIMDGELLNNSFSGYDISYDNNLHGSDNDFQSIDPKSSEELLSWLQGFLANDTSSFKNDTFLARLLYNLYSNSTDENFPQHSNNLIRRPAKVIAVVLSVVTVLANLCSLAAIGKSRGRLNANMRLIISLSISDILVSVSILAYVASFDVLPYGSSDGEGSGTCLYIVMRSFRMMAHQISLLNLLGLAIDHYFAIVRPLNYPILMSSERVKAMIIILWVIAFLCGFSDFYVPTLKYSYCEGLDDMNFCESVSCTTYDSETLLFAMTFFCVVVMTFLYIRIYIIIHNYHASEQRIQRRNKKNRKGLITTLLILGTFFSCYLPYCIFQIFITIQMKVNQSQIFRFFKMVLKLDFYLYDAMLMNSLCDPIIYAVRMNEVQLGYKRIFSMCLRKDKIKHRVQFSNSNSSSGRTPASYSSYRTVASQISRDSSSHSSKCKCSDV